MLHRVLNLLNHSIFARSVGSLSCIIGLICYALSSSFKSLFGEWNTTKIILYTIISSILTVVVLFAGKSRVPDISKLKPHVEFIVLMLTSLYSFFADRSTKGKPDTLSVVSSGAFAVTSLCLSRQIKPRFDVGLFNFFLGCVTIQLMKIHLLFMLVAAGFCYPQVVLGPHLELQSENEDSRTEGSVKTRIDGDDTSRASVGMGQHKAGQITPRRCVRNVSSNSLTQDDDRSGSFSNMSENGDSRAEESVETQIDDDDTNRASVGMDQDKAGQITQRRCVRNVSSNSLTQDDDRSGSFSNMSENGDSRAEGSVAIRIDDDAAQNEGSSNPFGMGQDKVGQIGLRRRLIIESPFGPNPSPPFRSRNEVQKFLVANWRNRLTVLKSQDKTRTSFWRKVFPLRPSPSSYERQMILDELDKLYGKLESELNRDLNISNGILSI